MATPVEQWVNDDCQDDASAEVVWCDGSQAEYDGLIERMLDDGSLMRLNQEAYPGCYLHRSHPSDVARTEHLLYLQPRRDDAGPTNNWMPPKKPGKVGKLFEGSMQSRTMYVVPYIMGTRRVTLQQGGRGDYRQPYVAPACAS